MEPGGEDHGGRRSVHVNPDRGHHGQANSESVSESFSQA
jgi:hypothetical protein